MSANSKKCPRCKYEECWIKAKTCEKCGYDFVLHRTPRKRKAVEPEEEEIILPPEEKPPEKLNKNCPHCHAVCWWKAPTCLKCNYDFKTGKHPEEEKVEVSSSGKSILMRDFWRAVSEKSKNKIAIPKIGKLLNNKTFGYVEDMDINEAANFILEQKEKDVHYLFFSMNGESYSVQELPKNWKKLKLKDKKKELGKLQDSHGLVREDVFMDGIHKYHDNSFRELLKGLLNSNGKWIPDEKL